MGNSLGEVLIVRAQSSRGNGTSRQNEILWMFVLEQVRENWPMKVNDDLIKRRVVCGKEPACLPLGHMGITCGYHLRTS